MNAREYRLATDNDSHHYVIPADKSLEWETWCEIDSDDERAWTPPEWAIEIGGSPTQVIFTGWRIE